MAEYRSSSHTVYDIENDALKSCFQDTLRFAEVNLKDKIDAAKRSNAVFGDGFVSYKPRKSAECLITVVESTTFAVAKSHIKDGKVAVLNFANPENPGGGVQNGAMAQEECLCRSSILYSCLIDDAIFNEYYQFHRQLNNTFFSDRLIYTKNVTVFKDDEVVPQLMAEDEWFDVDVITCAAPYLGGRKYTNLTALKKLFMARAKNIFEAAIENDVDILVLGAFGCGAFKNPPQIVAQAFERVIQENNYRKAFKKIIFAIKPTGHDCPNVYAFKSQFAIDSADADSGQRRLLSQNPDDWYFRKIPEISCLLNLKDKKVYTEHREKSFYFGKQFSILGDSISTLEGYNPRGYSVFYTGENCRKTLVYEYKDTWWGKVIDFFGGELLVNNSWSGSRVTKLPGSDRFFPAGCSDERTSLLHIQNTLPDIILVYLGTNDWARGVEVSVIDHILGQDETEVFEDAYEKMLRKLRTNYPKAEIWCCTLSSTYMSSEPGFVFPKTYAGIHIDKYNAMIRNVASANKCNIIDFDKYGWPYNSLDGSHPMLDGMDTLAMMAIREMSDASVNKIIDCANGMHTFEVVEEYTGGTRLVCKKCGKEKHIGILTPSAYDQLNNDEYVMLPRDTTRFLYSNTLHLTKESTGEKISIQKSLVKVGRHPACDLYFDSVDKYIARFHASFIFEGNSWYLRDDGSKNGTWLNGQKIKPQVKYELKANDAIDLARSEKITFYKTANHGVETFGYNEEERSLDFFVTDPMLGMIIENKYKIVKEIGRGSMSRVFLGLDKCLNKALTIQLYDKKQHRGQGIYNNVIQTAHMLIALEHPCIPHVIDIVENENYLFVIREYIEGRTLESIVRESGPMSADAVIEISKKICDILHYLHTLMPPHINRDIKPANVVAASDGKIKIVDFGIMRLYDPKKMQDTFFLGTKGYAAPEQYGGIGQTDARTDIFGLGMTMYNLVTGVNPNDPPYEIRPIRQINPALPKHLEKIICKCIELNPAKRYQSAAALLAALNGEKDPDALQGLLGKIFGKK